MIDRTRPPQGGVPRPFRFPPFHRYRCDNGITVLAARQPRFPLVSLELVTPIGAWHDPPGLGGLTTLHAGLLDEGTEDKTALELATAVEQLGGQLGSSASWNATFAAATGLSRHRDAFLELLGEVVLCPSFPEQEIERARARRLAELLRRRSQPAILADELFARACYGDSPYGRSLFGDERSANAADRQALLDFYRHRFLAAGATCVAVGDLDPEDTLRQVGERLAAWPAMQPPDPPSVPVPVSDGPRVVLVDRSGAQQTELRIGHPSVPFHHPDRPILAVLNSLLGGKFTSRINLNLREAHGYTYGAYSRFVQRLGPGPFLVSAAVANGVAADAAGEVLREIGRIREQAVGGDELEDTLRYLLGVFPYTVQTIGDLVKRFEEIAVFDLPDDHFDRYLEAIRRVTAEEVLRVAREHLNPEQMILLACGPADALTAPFRRFAEPELIREEPRGPRNG